MKGCLRALRRLRRVSFLILMVFLLILSTITFAAEDTAHPLVRADSAPVSVNYAVNPGFEWRYCADYSAAGYDAYIAGNSFTNTANVSNIAVTVTGAGVFSFDYKISISSNGDFYALYYNVNQPIDMTNYKVAKNHNKYPSFRGVVDWTHMEFNITAADLNEDGQATVYIAYYRGGSIVTNLNMVAIANVYFVSGEKKLTLNVTGGEYGSVTDGNSNTYSGESHLISYNAGDAVVLTATVTPETGGRFYGWIDGSGNFLTTADTLSFTISSDIALKAVFALDGSYVARRNDIFYTEADGGLAQALADAQQGDSIVMLENQRLSADAVVPNGAKLYIPYSVQFDVDGNADGVTTAGIYQASAKIATSEMTYRALTIDSGVTLTVNGTLNIGSVIGYPAQYYQGHTSGWHGKIENNGDIVIRSGGTLDCWGLITGAGKVTAQSGSSVYEPFIVYDYAGGSNTASLYLNNQSPFKQYAMQNIQTPLVINFGAMLYGRCNLWASSNYNKTDIVFIGAGGMYQLASGATVTRSYDEGKHISTNTDIGKTAYTFSGGMTFASLTMPIKGVTVSTEHVEFPISYNSDVVLENGDYTILGRFKLMPGANMRVENGANLSVKGTLFALDGLIQSDMSYKSYPSTAILQAAGFSGAGQLFVNGTMLVNQGAIFGGVIQTAAVGDNPATVTIESGAVVDSTNVQDGAVGDYDVNTAVFDLPARAYIYDSTTGKYVLRELYDGSIYTVHDRLAWTLPDYTMVYAANCSEAESSPDIPVRSNSYHKWVTATVPLNETRTGSWVADAPGYAVTVINETTYDSLDSTRTAVSGDNIGGLIIAGGDVTFSVASTEAGRGYVYQVSYVSGTDEPVVIVADAEGNYTISNVENDVTITVTACILGDVNLNGVINTLDLLELRKILAEAITPTDFQRLAANTDRDLMGTINTLDLLRLRRYIAEEISDFY